jgi:hypothetical protein
MSVPGLSEGRWRLNHDAKRNERGKSKLGGGQSSNLRKAQDTKGKGGVKSGVGTCVGGLAMSMVVMLEVYSLRIGVERTLLSNSEV